MGLRRYFCELKDDHWGYLSIYHEEIVFMIRKGTYYLHTQDIPTDKFYDLVLMYLDLDTPLSCKKSYVNEFWMSIEDGRHRIQSKLFKSKESLRDRLKYLFDK